MTWRKPRFGLFRYHSGCDRFAPTLSSAGWSALPLRVRASSLGGSTPWITFLAGAGAIQAQTQLDTTRVQDTDVTVQRAPFRTRHLRPHRQAARGFQPSGSAGQYSASGYPDRAAIRTFAASPGYCGCGKAHGGSESANPRSALARRFSLPRRLLWRILGMR